MKLWRWPQDDLSERTALLDLRGISGDDPPGARMQTRFDEAHPHQE
jgi:UTP:GlnB (protein PII) uridylyltransferase